ncbi:MAG: efflux RND transporter periplasmic adaptor subunit [Pseudomonadota bacterium]
MARIIMMTGLVCLLAATAHPMAAQTVLRPVHLMTVGAESGGVTRQFFGQVVARETVDLAFQVSGQVVRFPAAEGEPIAQGALIAELDLEPFELQLQQAQLNFDQAERALARQNQLSTVSEVSREDAETSLGLARVALRNATYSLENATLAAPFDGLVASRNIANFSTVNAGTPVVRLHDMSELRIEIDVPEVLFQRAGEDAEVALVAQFPTSDETYPLEIREFNAEASSVGQTFRITLALSRPEGLNVLPGSSATVFATLASDDTFMRLPPSAVRIASDGATSVMRFVPGEDDLGTLEEVAVTLAPDRNGEVVVSDGIEPGDLIVRTGAHTVADGETVRRFAGYPN